MQAEQPLALIIEDDPGAAEALGLILRDWGAEVAYGSDGGAVWSMGSRLKQVRWIITDFHLGRGQDGVTVIQRLAKAAPQARILVLSGSFQGRGTAEAAAAGYEVMSKPARAEAIISWLERG